MIVSLQVYTDAHEKDMRKQGIPATKDLFYKILEVLTGYLGKTSRFRKKHSKSKDSPGNFGKQSARVKR